MELAKQREQILATLRAACRTGLRSEETACIDIQQAVARVSFADEGQSARKARVDRYVYELSLIYTHQTGAMPGFTNSESETRFERFAYAIAIPAELKLTRNLLKACIRRIDAKRNPQFASDLRRLTGETAAE